MFVCTVCNKSFNYKSYLIRHQKSVQCNIGDNLLHVIDKDVNIEIAPKAFNCQHCDFTTKFKPNLCRHRKTCNVLVAQAQAQAQAQAAEKNAETKQKAKHDIRQLINSELDKYKEQIKIELRDEIMKEFKRI